MSRSIFQNIPDAEKLLGMDVEELAGYVLEHLHSLSAHEFQSNSHPGNLANHIASRYPTPYKQNVDGVIRQAINWLTNRDYLYPRNNEGWLSFTKRGQNIKTADDLASMQKVTGKDDNEPALATLSQSSIPTLKMADETQGKSSTSTDTPATISNSDTLLNNRYRILSAFPTSGFCQAFLAEDIFLPSKRRCVIKRFTYTSQNPETYNLILERFEREATVLEKLSESHEQIPNLLAHFSENGQFYQVQEWVKGETVAAVVASNGTFNEERVKGVLKSLLPVLEYVHSHSIIHRDIKPENVVLREGDFTPFLIDFGAVKEVVGTMVDPFGNPSTTIVVGTQGYMPPEQVAGRPVYVSDLYSLSLTAIYMLTGKRPQELLDLGTGEMMWRDVAKDVSDELAAILDKSIRDNFRERFSSARAMLDALDSATQVTTPHAPAPKNEPASERGIETTKAITVGGQLLIDEPEHLHPNISQVATWWLKSFLSPVINLLGLIKKEFNQGGFNVSATPIQLYSQIFIYRIDFSKLGSWNELLSSDVGEYFLRTYPEIENKVTSFVELAKGFDLSVSALYQVVEESQVFLRLLIDTYERLIQRERIPRSQFEKSDLQEISKLLLGELHLQMSNYPAESKDNLVRITAYSLLKLNVEFPLHALRDDEKLISFCRDISNSLREDDERVFAAVTETTRLFEVVKRESEILWKQLREARMDIAKRYTATWE